MARKIPIIVINGVEGKDCASCQVWHPKTSYYMVKKPGQSDYWQCKKLQRLNLIRYYDNKLATGKLDAIRESIKKAEKIRLDRKKTSDIRAWKMYKMLNAAKRRAKEKKLSFNITQADFPEFRELVFCPVMPWIKLVWDRPQQSDDSPSFDRIVDSLGYVRGNVRIISWRANDVKRNSSLDELEAVYNDGIALARKKTA